MYRFRSEVDREKVFTCVLKVWLRSYSILYPIITLHVNPYRISRSSHARDLAAGGREPEVEGDGSRDVVAIDI